MHKILVTNPLIASYSAFLLLGLIAGYLLARWRAARIGITGEHIDNLTLLIAISSLFGARVFSWWFEFPEGVTLWEALTTSSGGMVFYGGVIFGMLAVIAYAAFAFVSPAALLDACAPGLALGLAFGRIGCFMAGCCWGDLCINNSLANQIHDPAVLRQVRSVPFLSPANFPFAVRFPADSGAYEQHQQLGLIPKGAAQSLAVHPVQLYETILALALCLVLHRSFKSRTWDGQVFWRLLMGYGIIRFILEFLRADNPRVFAGLTLSQMISLALIAAAVAVFRRHGSGVRIPQLRPVRLD